MQAIIDGLLYDTYKAEEIYNFYYSHSQDGFTIYKTKNNRIFIETSSCEFITDGERVRDMIGRNCPDKYIELFGEVEEA